ncbi:MAG: hypothetical protein NTW87_20985 [Planctomycetota bacterium]|nr:hypothetical protein [Planctomycetota bacterium]
MEPEDPTSTTPAAPVNAASESPTHQAANAAAPPITELDLSHRPYASVQRHPNRPNLYIHFRPFGETKVVKRSSYTKDSCEAGQIAKAMNWAWQHRKRSRDAVSGQVQALLAAPYYGFFWRPWCNAQSPEEYRPWPSCYLYFLGGKQIGIRFRLPNAGQDDLLACRTLRGADGLCVQPPKAGQRIDEAEAKRIKADILRGQTNPELVEKRGLHPVALTLLTPPYGVNIPGGDKPSAKKTVNVYHLTGDSWNFAFWHPAREKYVNKCVTVKGTKPPRPGRYAVSAKELRKAFPPALRTVRDHIARLKSNTKYHAENGRDLATTDGIDPHAVNAFFVEDARGSSRLPEGSVRVLGNGRGYKRMYFRNPVTKKVVRLYIGRLATTEEQEKIERDFKELLTDPRYRAKDGRQLAKQKNLHAKAVTAFYDYDDPDWQQWLRGGTPPAPATGASQGERQTTPAPITTAPPATDSQAGTPPAAAGREPQAPKEPHNAPVKAAKPNGAAAESGTFTSRQLWKWETLHQRLSVVAAHLASLLSVSVRTVQNWSTLYGWSRGMTRPDNRSVAVSREQVLKTLKEMGYARLRGSHRAEPT